MQKRFIRLVVIAFLLVLGSGSSDIQVVSSQAPNGLADTPWPMYQHDPQHTGRSPMVGPVNKPVLLWIYQIPDALLELNGEIAIASDGSLITPHGGKLKSIDPVEHTVNWFSTIGGSHDQVPLITADGTIYFGNSVYMYKVSPAGLLQWTFNIPTYNFAGDGSPTLGPDGNIYFYHDGLFSVSPSKFFRWAYFFSFSSHANLAIGHNGILYGLLGNWDLAALDTDGNILWSIYLPPSTSRSIMCSISPAVGDDGTIYQTVHNSIYAVNPDGTIKWRFTTPEEDKTGGDFLGFAIAPNGNIYGAIYSLHPDGPMLYALNSDGEEIWNTKFQKNPITDKIGLPGGPMLTDRQGNVYLCVGNSYCYGFRQDGALLWDYELPLVDSIALSGNSQPVLAEDGLLYFIDNHSHLYALADPTQFPTMSTNVTEFAYELEAGTPAFSVTIPLTSTLQSVSFTSTVTPTNWLDVSNANLATPHDLSIEIDPSMLAIGYYHGSIRIRTLERVGSWIDIPVKLKIKSASPPRLGNYVFLPVVQNNPYGFPVYSGAIRIAYLRNYFLEHQLVTVDEYGENLQIVASGLPQIDEVVMSPDGVTAAFVENKKGLLSTRIVDMKTGGTMLEITGGEHNFQPVFSPDGKQLLFYSYRDNYNGELYKINLDGSGLTRLTNNQSYEGNANWSPNGEQISYVIQSCYSYVMNSDGSNPRPFNLDSCVKIEDWSPDGKYLLLRDEWWVSYPYEVRNDLWIYEIATGNFRIVDQGVIPVGKPEWSLDGKHIGYFKVENENTVLYVTEVTEGASKVVMAIFPGYSSDPDWSWSPDGKWIAFARERAGYKYDIYLTSIDDRTTRLLTTNVLDDSFPNWLHVK